MGSVRAKSRKRPANLSIDAELLKTARKRKINLSQTLETALRNELATVTQQEWLAENEKALDAYADHVEAHGVFSDGLRRF